LRVRVAALLTGVARALKGDPGPLRLWDWGDLPEVAKRLKSDLGKSEYDKEMLRQALNRQSAELDRASLSARDQGGTVPTDREREIEARARAAAQRIAYEPAPASEGEVDTMARIIAEEMAKLDKPQAPREVGGSIGYD
jgi:hypothetical protein